MMDRISSSAANMIAHRNCMRFGTKVLTNVSKPKPTFRTTFLLIFPHGQPYLIQNKLVGCLLFDPKWPVSTISHEGNSLTTVVIAASPIEVGVESSMVQLSSPPCIPTIIECNNEGYPRTKLRASSRRDERSRVQSNDLNCRPDRSAVSSLYQQRRTKTVQCPLSDLISHGRIIR